MRVKSEAKRQSILDVAADVFSERGFEHTSMSEISTRVGGSKKTLYSYFESKEELFFEVMCEFARQQMWDVLSMMKPENDVAGSLRAWGGKMIRMITSPRMIAVLRVAFAQAGRGRASRLFYENGLKMGLDELSAYMEGCQKLGKLRDGEPLMLARFFIAMLRAETMEELLLGVSAQEELPDLDQVVERAVGVFLRAFSAPEAGRA